MTKPDLINHQDICVEVIRSNRRKTMALQISKGKTVIRMPQRLPMHFAEKFVAQKYHWIKQKLAQQPIIVERHFVNGEQILFQGNLLTLQFISASHNRTWQESAHLMVELRAPERSERRKKRVVSWLRDQAESYFEQRLAILSKMTGLKPNSLKVRSYKARWGSCSIHGDIHLNWKLIMAPPAVIDYVIIHELCHIRHHNHSKAFWQLVKQFEPMMASHRNWLKQHGLQLEL